MRVVPATSRNCAWPWPMRRKACRPTAPGSSGTAELFRHDWPTDSSGDRLPADLHSFSCRPGRRSLLFILLIGALADVAMAAPKTIAVWTRSTFSTDEADALRAAALAFNSAQHVYK